MRSTTCGTPYNSVSTQGREREDVEVINLMCRITTIIIITLTDPGIPTSVQLVDKNKQGRNSITWDHLTVFSFKNVINKLCLQIIYI